MYTNMYCRPDTCLGFLFCTICAFTAWRVNDLLWVSSGVSYRYNYFQGLTTISRWFCISNERPLFHVAY